MLYLVTWKIDIDADSPREAAQKAREIQLSPDSTATVFDVAPEKGDPVRIDLLEEPKTPLSQIRIYDNGGKTFDRYTAVFMDRPIGLHRRRLAGLASGQCAAIAFSDSPFSPTGFGQHTSAMPGRHLGKRIKFEDLNADCQQFINQNL